LDSHDLHGQANIRSRATSMHWYVYLLMCAARTLYCVATNVLERPIARDSNWRVKYARGRFPVEMVWADGAGDMREAMRAEAYVKQWTRAAKLILLGQQ